MLDAIMKKWSKPLPKNEIIDFVLNLDEHSWIKSNKYMFLNIQDFLERLPTRTLQEVFIEKSTFFKLSDLDDHSLFSGQGNCFSIYIKEELYEQIGKINDGWAKAILAHEVALIQQDAHLSDDEMETKVDADEFACEIGLLEELEDYLHSRPDSVEKMVRLSFITSYYFSKVENQDF